ncbi:UNVERIFIED_CONTAM: DNA mismatch repair protein MSH6 [Sesamum calycinum]|uniref:DNA mismatch repair protein MSH6 n=1 Tax=Sesamum calycinum TaxID=2727403 RepID=A0AAW2MCP5_9LAMI
MAQKLQQQLKELGSKLESPPASKDALIKLLKQGAACLSELDQSPPKPIVESMQPLLNAVVKPELLKHQDREVKLLVASCICEITRITAPEAPYDDDVLKDTFQLIVSTFSGLSDINGPTFGRRVVILETLARYRSCVVMLDLECDDLIDEMFNIFFAVARDEHPGNVLTSMETIMEVLLEESEDVPENLLLILLSILGRDKEDVTLAGRRLAMNVIGNCAAKLEPSIKQFLVSSMSGDSRPLKCEINYHRVLYDIYRCAPQILSGVVPYLTGELLSDQLDIRLKAVGLVGDLFALPGSTISEAFKPVLLEFLKRLTDRVVEVRMSVLEYVKICLLENPFRAEAHQMIYALADRLLDYDENVRKQVVSVVCDVACHALTSIPVDTIKLVSERLRDKSLLVKRYTMERLADIYRVSCMKRSSDSTKDDEYDWIVGKILRCFYDKDFRSDAIEPIISLSLFPVDFSVKDKVTNWVRIFSGFDKVDYIAFQLHDLVSASYMFTTLVQVTTRDAEEGDGTEIEKKVMFCFRVMSRCFTDPAKAEESFQILDQLKDSNIWKILLQLLNPDTSSVEASNLRDDLLKILGQKHRLSEFLSTLSLKCSYLLFDKDHVKEILLEAGVKKSTGSTDLILSCMTILVILARFCPLLLGGIEEDLVLSLEDDNEIIKEGTLHILAKAGELSENNWVFIKGSRRQAKYAVHALASITKDDGLMSLSVLYKRLVDLLEEKSHLPAVLQSLGCIAQAAMPVFETRESEVEKFIKANILELGHIAGEKATGCWDDSSELCSLKIFGIKALVKSYLPVKDAHLRSGIDGIIEILKNILLFGDISREIKSSLVDKAHLKLAAAKAILRLSKHWEHKIPVDVLYLALRTSEDNFPEVSKLLLDKVHEYVRDRILDPKYACAFLLDISSESDLEENKRYLNDIIQMCRQGRGRHITLQTDAMSPPLYPEYILPYVVHAVAHHPSFPNIDDECKDVKRFEPIYRQLYLFLSMLVHGDADGKSDISSKDKDSVLLLNSLLQCIKHSEDAFDAAKSKNLYALCDLGMPIIKRLAPKQDDLQYSSVSVTLPPVLYKPLEKKGENDSLNMDTGLKLLVGEVKTWLADEGVVAHFESLQLEANGIVHSVISEDDVMKDSETEGSEMPLGKLMKRLKAKAAKAKKEVKNEPAQAGVANENDFDILKMVKEINTDSLGANTKFESSNGHGRARRKRRSGDECEERNMLSSESTDVPVPKRRRTPSGQSYRSPSAVSSKDSKRPTNVNQENINNDSDKTDEKPQTSSEDQSMQEKTAESPEFKLLSSRFRKKSNSSSKQKGKRSGRNHDVVLNNSPEAKKPKKVRNTESPRTITSSKLGSMKKQRPESVMGIGKCTTKDNRSSEEDLIGCRIKVWWPMDKQYYEGVVKSFDTQKNKHVILYDDGDVEVLRLERERWELIDNGLEAKRSGSSKGLPPKGGSSGQRRKSSGGRKQNKKLEEKSLSSEVRKKKTAGKGPKQRPKATLKSKSFRESGGSPDGAHPEFTSSVDDSDSENERTTKSLADEELSDKDQKQEQDVEKELSDAEEPKDDEKDSEDTESDNLHGSPHDAHGSENEAISSSDKKQPNKNNDESTDEADSLHSHATASEKLDNKTSASDSSDTELSDNEPLSMWKQRSGRKDDKMFGFSVRTWPNGFGSPKSTNSPTVAGSPAPVESPKASNSPRTDVGEIDTRAPFESVKAAQRLLEKETQHHMVLKELEYYKDQLRIAESAKSQALRDLQRANRTLQELTNKLEALSESKQAAIKATEAAKSRAKELEEQQSLKAQLGSEAWKLDVDTERERYKTSSGELSACRRCRQATKTNQERQSQLAKEVAMLRDTLDQVKRASHQAQEEHLKLIAEKEVHLLVHKSAKEVAEKDIKRLREQYGPEENLEVKLEEATEAIKVVQEQLHNVRTADFNSLQAVISELECAKKELEEIVAEEASLRSSVDSLKQQLEEAKRKHYEFETKALEAESTMEKMQADLKNCKSELETAMSRNVVRDMQSNLDKLLAQAEKDRREAEGIQRDIELFSQEAEALTAAAKEADEKLQIALKEVEAAKVAEKLADDQIHNSPRTDAADLKGQGSARRIRLSVEEFEAMKQKIEACKNQADEKVAALMAQVQTINASEDQVLQKVEGILKESDDIQSEIEDALKRAEMAEAAKKVVEGELQKWSEKAENEVGEPSYVSEEKS